MASASSGARQGNSPSSRSPAGPSPTRPPHDDSGRIASDADAQRGALRYACKCGNVRLFLGATDAAGGEKRGGADELDALEMAIRHPELTLERPVTVVNGDAGGSSDRASDDASPEKGDRTLVCLVCETEVLRTSPVAGEGETTGAHSRQTSAVLVDPVDPSRPSRSSLSPLYHLALPPLAQPSTFACPPSTPPAPPTPLDGPSPPAPTYLPPPPDPFFLPPPFTPSHPFFLALAARATEAVLRAREQREDAVRRAIAREREGMRAFEAEVRGEVERVWAAYRRGREEEERERSGERERKEGEQKRSSGSMERRTSFGKASVGEAGVRAGAGVRATAAAARRALDVPAPGIMVTSPTPFGTYAGAGSTSLLSASLAGHSFFPPPLARSSSGSVPGAGSGTGSPGSHGRNGTPLSPPAQHVQGPDTIPPSPRVDAPPRSWDNPVAAPYRRPKSGIDLDVAASLKVRGFMDDLDRAGAERLGRPAGSMRRGSSGRAPRVREQEIEDEARRDPATMDMSPSRLDEVAAHDLRLERERAREREAQREAEIEQLDRFEEDIVRPAAGGVEEERTPRARTVKHLNSGSVDKSPIKSGSARSVGALTPEKAQGAPPRHVKFQEPQEAKAEGKRGGALGLLPEESVVEDEDEEDVVLVGHDDAVFDFEDNDIPLDEQHDTSPSPVPASAGSNPTPPAVPGLSRESSDSSASSQQLRQIMSDKENVENKLSDLVAADAPSHRSAWKNKKHSLWQIMGRSQAKQAAALGAEVDDARDETKLSACASSMPIAIQWSPTASSPSGDRELKTSLREKQGIFVPPLKPAMKGSKRTSSGLAPTSPISEGPSEGSDAAPSTAPIATGPGDHTDSRSSSRNRRQSSLSRKPDPASAIVAASMGGYSLRQTRSISGSRDADPGPALEGVEDDVTENDDADDVVGGTSFVPPHVRKMSEDT